MTNLLCLIPLLHGVPGETGHMYLQQNAVGIHPFTNDIGGQTDKLFSHGMYVGLLQNRREFRLSWRIITPSFQDKRDVTPLRKEPVGRYADWIEAQNAITYPLNPRFGLSINYGIGKVGNNGAQALQYWWHNLFNVNSNKRLTWDDQIVGWKVSYGAEIKTCNINPIIAAGYHKNLFTEEIYIKANTVIEDRIGLEVISARLFGGELGLDYRSIRYEAGIALKVSSIYAPSIRYVSSYIKKDSYSQIYYDLLNFYIEL